MSIGTPNGILDITGATLRVSKMEFRQSTGFDTVLNNVARNTMLLMDETEQTTSNSWALKLPNAWVAEFHGYWASGSSGAPILFNFYNDSTSGTNGYTLSMDDTAISINYDGGSVLGSATLSSTLNNDAYRKVAVIFERSVLDVSVDGEHVFHFADSQLRDRVYDNNSGYVTFTHSSTDERKLKNLKFTNGDKWVREIDSSNIAYVGGNVGIGTTIPGTKLDVSGTVRGTHLIGDGSAISSIQSSNVSDFGSNVTRIGTLETDLGDNSARITNLSSNLSDNSSRITTLESGDISISGDKTFTGDIIFESNVHMNGGNVFVANTVNMTVSDPIIELGSNNLNTGDLGIIMTRHGATNSNVAIVYDEDVDILRMGYTLNGASDSVVDLDSNALAVSVQGNLEVGIANLFVDTTTSRVGINVASPSYTLDVGGDVNLSTGSTLRINGTPAVFSNWTVSGSDIYRSSGKVGVGTTSPDSIFHTESSVGADEVWVDQWKHVFNADWNFRLSQRHDAGVSVEYGIKQRYNQTEYSPITFRGSTMELGGNVGIGTASPYGTLGIYTGSTATAGLTIDRHSSGTYRSELYQESDGLAIKVGDGTNAPTENMRITSSTIATAGKLTVGSGTAYSSSQMYVNAAGDGSTTANTDLHVLPNAQMIMYGTRPWITTTNAQGHYDKQCSLSLHASGHMPGIEWVRNNSQGTNQKNWLLRQDTDDGLFLWHYNGSAWSVPIGFNKDGKLGVGTSSPNVQLHIQGTSPRTLSTSNGPSYSDYGQLVITDTTAPSGTGTLGNLKIGFDASTGSFGTGFLQCVNPNVYSGPLVLNPYGGNVGIGLTGPQSKLHIYGSDNPLAIQSYRSPYPTLSYDFSGVNAENLQFYDHHGSGRGFLYGRKYTTGTTLNANAGWHFYGNDNTVGIRIDGSGNVGIGTPNPGYPLHVYKSATWPTFVVRPTSLWGDGLTTASETAGTQYMTVGMTMFQGPHITPHSVGGDAYIRYGRAGGIASGDWWETALRTDGSFHIAKNGVVGSAIHISSAGKVGMASNSPLSQLDVIGGLCIHQQAGTINWYNGAVSMSVQGYKGLMFTVNGDNWNNGGSSTYWMIGRVPYNSNLHFSGGGRYSCYMRSNTANSALNFTGQHRTFIKDVPFTKANDFEGLIVSASQNKYIKMNGGIEAGSNAITTNESLPIVTISNTSKDKKCFGVISASEDPETREDEYGSLVTVIVKESGDTRVYINSVGEGAIWVTNINGNLESGDYITTSNVAGYGMRQDDDILHNYTVAKITMDCDFEPVTQSVQQIVKELSNVNYWVETTYSNVALEEYSNLAEENRRTVTDNEIVTYQKIERTESTTEHEGWTLDVRQELVNVLDEHGQLQWEDHPTETEKAYKIRYLTNDGQITDEANAVHIAAFVGCTYHCG